MKNNKWIIFGLALTFASSLYAANQDCLVIGFHQPGTHTYAGPTFCNDVNFKNITVYGPLEVSNHSVISGESDVSGPVKLSQSTVDDLVSKNTISTGSVALTQSSCVNGNITFIGKPGVVTIDSSSTLNGNVINGTIQKTAKQK